MAFVYKKIETLPIQVDIEVPTGKAFPEKCSFTAVWKKLPISQVTEIGKKMESQEITFREVAHQYLVGIEGIKDEHGNNIELTPEFLDEMLETEYMFAPLINSYVNVQMGPARPAIEKAQKEKN